MTGVKAIKGGEFKRFESTQLTPKEVPYKKVKYRVTSIDHFIERLQEKCAEDLKRILVVESAEEREEREELEAKEMGI